jgi:hypothetical protein
MRRIGKSIKNVEQDLEAKDLAAKEHIEGKPSSEKFNKAKDQSRGWLLEIFEGISR